MKKTVVKSVWRSRNSSVQLTGEIWSELACAVTVRPWPLPLVLDTLMGQLARTQVMPIRVIWSSGAVHILSTWAWCVCNWGCGQRLSLLDLHPQSKHRNLDL
ncbi:hypothetical protein RRG08_065206 [Elysia crispata]|uniref:Uncharacterized protein n=1 Tax=Elysia crispata TaxID=231223 RepID=A0AAE1D1J3_9GAST|nr:hypothetical protein RRG08_065206 [Elysia crispata]